MRLDALAHMVRSRRPEAAADMPGSMELAELALQARHEIEAAHRQFGEVQDEELVDHAIFRLRAAERHYVYLLRLAREQGAQLEGVDIESTRG